MARNGKRVRRFAAYPGEGNEADMEVKPGADGCKTVQMGAIQTSSAHNHNHKDKDKDNHHHNHQPEAAAVAGFSPEEVQRRAEMLQRRPEWFTGKVWISRRSALELAALPLTSEDVAAVYAEARKSRGELASPAGYVVSELKRVAAMNGGERDA